MKLSDRIVEALMTGDDGAIGRAFKAAYAITTGHEQADDLVNVCINAQDESYLSMVLILETVFEEEEKNG